MSTMKVDFGTPSTDFEEWFTTEVRFHGFADQTTETNVAVRSPDFLCLGHRWTVDICPGDNPSSNHDKVSIALNNNAGGVPTATEILFTYSIRDRGM